MARPNIDDALASIQAIGDRVLEIGIDKVAEESGLKRAIVKRFTVDCMRSKNTEIRKISAAVTKLEELRKI